MESTLILGMYEAHQRFFYNLYTIVYHDGAFCPIRFQYFDVNNHRLFTKPTIIDGMCQPKRMPAPPIRPSVTNIPVKAGVYGSFSSPFISFHMFHATVLA